MKIQPLLEMLSWKRPAYSATENAFVQKYVMSLPNAKKDGFGNVIVDVGNPSILFSCHTDTAEREGGFRKIIYDDLFGFITAENSILGADDGCGVFIMRMMIENGVEGRYIFHRCEEIGALGSQWIVENTPEVLRGMKAAIAFDRKGCNDVIDEMILGRTCSKQFAQRLSGMLTENHSPAPGLYTDTAFYCGIIPECTNVSVGYYNEHTHDESLDVAYFEWLCHRVLEIDWKKLC